MGEPSSSMERSPSGKSPAALRPGSNAARHASGASDGRGSGGRAAAAASSSSAKRL